MGAVAPATTFGLQRIMESIGVIESPCDAAVEADAGAVEEAHAACGDGEREASDFFGLADALLRMTVFELGVEFRLAGEAGLEHVGFDGGWFDGVDAHARAEVDGQRAGHTGQGGLAGGVGDEVLFGEPGVDAADVDHTSFGHFEFR